MVNVSGRGDKDIGIMTREMNLSGAANSEQRTGNSEGGR